MDVKGPNKNINCHVSLIHIEWGCLLETDYEHNNIKKYETKITNNENLHGMCQILQTMKIFITVHIRDYRTQI